jgi:pimeloyl-ACP methyl ester carboxylesterase
MPTFQHEHIVLNYQVIGKGNKHIIAFHGFGKTSNDYQLFSEYFGSEYKVFAVDLFYHGKTKIDGRKVRAFSKRHLRDFFQDFITHLGINKFEVMGYSMGGRMALFFLEQFAAQIEKIYLLAPDGLKKEFWNWLVTNTKTGKNLYGFTIHHPGWLKTAVSAGKKFNILPEKIDKFLDLSFGTKGARLRVYRVWKLYKHIAFDMDVLQLLAKQHQIKFEIVVGKKDPVVSPKQCRDFHDQIGKNSRYHLIAAGHDLFKPHTVKYIGENVL